MMVAGGYPDVYEKGKQIYGLNSVVDSLVFHAGTIADGPSVLTSGGRVLAVTSYGKNIEVAIFIELEESFSNSTLLLLTGKTTTHIRNIKINLKCLKKLNSISKHAIC